MKEAFYKNLQNILLVGVIILGIISIIGSAPRYIVRSIPTTPLVDNEYFTATIEPISVYYGGTQLNAFRLNVSNKTNKDLTIIWDKTLYILDGRTTGTFMFEGIIYKDRNNPKPPDIVFTKTTFSKIISPCNLVHFSKGWYHEPLPIGENGVYLTIAVEGKEITGKMVVNLVQEKQ